MGAPDIPDAAAPPAAPEPVKKKDTEVLKARDTARSEAIRRFGVIGTDKTAGSLGDTSSADVKQKTLGA